MNELAQNIFYRLNTYTVWNDLDNQVKDLITEAINIGIDGIPKQVSVEPEVKSEIADIKDYNLSYKYSVACRALAYELKDKQYDTETINAFGLVINDIPEV